MSSTTDLRRNDIHTPDNTPKILIQGHQGNLQTSGNGGVEGIRAPQAMINGQISS